MNETIKQNTARWTSLGGFMAAVGASLCCAGPLVLLSLGISGAWISHLTALEPYRPIFIIAVCALFGWSGWQLFKPQSECAAETVCAQETTRGRRQKIFLILLIVAAALVASPYWLLWFY
ncbi:mercuric transporter MerT family protein [Simiduia aestuariiviva]|uniref:Mercuric transport protein MerT n=1 Tax=Simiduia aestuariiviva TaxID=1510459 RepID=A0A839UPY9_9GAMM|nr:mercuric transporter MerT family protein [Simiduia aestuariiviva]MBB3167445.1 mercuric ion transport protein [Simiduia aestuariiviva]